MFICLLHIHLHNPQNGRWNHEFQLSGIHSLWKEAPADPPLPTLLENRQTKTAPWQSNNQLTSASALAATQELSTTESTKVGGHERRCRQEGNHIKIPLVGCISVKQASRLSDTKKKRQGDKYLKLQKSFNGKAAWGRESGNYKNVKCPAGGRVYPQSQA